MSFKEKQNSGSVSLLLSVIFALIGFIIFIINSTTGYLAGSQIDTGTLILSIIAIVFGTLLFLFKDSMKRYESLIAITVGVLLSTAVCLFIYSRINLAADVWFIPVNYPEAEETALMVSIVGVAFYVLSIVALAISTILGIEAKPSKQIEVVKE